MLTQCDQKMGGGGEEDTSKRKKRHVPDWEKPFAPRLSDKKLRFGICKDLLGINKRMSDESIEKDLNHLREELNGHSVCVCVRLSTISDCLKPHGLYSPRLLCPWDFPGRILKWVAIPFSRKSSRPRD